MCADMPDAERVAVRRGTHDSADTEVPLAVIDGDGRLTGVIPRVTLLAALGDISAKSDNYAGAGDGSQTSDGAGTTPEGKEVTA